MSSTTRREYDFGAAVYGSILVSALVGAMFEGSADSRSMTLSLLGSVLIFWVAHTWSDVIGERVAEGSLFQSAEIRSIAVHEWPLVEAGLLPGVLLATAWIGWYSRHTGVALALAAAVVQLVAWGMFAGHRTETRWHRALLVGLFDGALGIGIVALEIAVHRV
ncbi:MAG: hypothetical protein ABI317_00550 [Gaiellales bacterium]